MSHQRSWGFSSHNGSNLENVDDVLHRLSERSKARETVIVDRVSDLQIRWEDQDKDHPIPGYYSTINGRSLFLNDNALRTSNRLIKSQPGFWEQHQDRDAFPKTLAHILNNRDNPSLLVRHNGVAVNAILPANYIVRDTAEILDSIIPSVRESVGEVRGISVIDEGDGDRTSIRIIVGNNIIPALKEDFGQYMMFVVNNSETGAMSTEYIMGLFRTICTNSAIQGQSRRVKWDHYSESKFETFSDTMGESIRNMGYLSSQYEAIFGYMLERELEFPAIDLLKSMRSDNMITRDHFEFAVSLSTQPTEDGREISNQYDLFNLLTASARSLQGLRARQQAEQVSLEMFSFPGGLFASMENAHRRFGRANSENSDHMFDEDSQ